MTSAAMLAAIAADSTDILARLVYADWLDEFGDEEAWQTYLDRFPDHHEMRERFGAWLAVRGDERAEGYRALGVQAIQPRKCLGEFLWHWSVDGKSCEVIPTWAALTGIMPTDWWNSLPGEKGPNVWPKKKGDCLTRREAENAAALAFAKLPATRRLELLTVPVLTATEG